MNFAAALTIAGVPATLHAQALACIDLADQRSRGLLRSKIKTRLLYPGRIARAMQWQHERLLAGAPDETLSSRAHRMRAKGQPYWGWTANAIDRIFFWQPGHCEAAYLSEQRRKQMPPALRN